MDTALAGTAGVSQPRASQVLRQLHDLGFVDSPGRGRWLPRREDLLDRFLAEYLGPGGSDHYFYSLDPNPWVLRLGRLRTVQARMTGGVHSSRRRS
jgi:hypothetical protein